MNYKKIIALICSVSIVISLSACSGSNETEDITDSASDEIITTITETETSITETETSTEETTTEAPKPVFEKCPYAELNYIQFTRESSIGISGWDMYLKNNSDKPITNMKVAIMGFDENFLPTSEKPIEKEFSPNLMANESSVYSEAQIGEDVDYGISGKYFVGVITYVKFRDGSDWTAENLDIWIDDVYKSFDLDDWLEIRETLKEDAKKAEKNEYLNNVTGIYVFHPSWVDNNNYGITWNHPDNLSESEDKIAKYWISVMMYDKNGKYLDHISGSTDAFDFQAGDFGYYVPDGISPDNVGYTKNIISMIKFKDGTVWTNPYGGAWNYYNEYDLDLSK